MKLKKEYIDHIFDRQFRFRDFIVFEGDEVEQLNILLNQHSSVEIDLRDPVRLFDYLEHLVFTSAPSRVHRTSFARKQYALFWTEKYAEVSPLLANIFGVLYPMRDKCQAYKSKIEHNASTLLDRKHLV
jgi:hypothetical protein